MKAVVRSVHLCRSRSYSAVCPDLARAARLFASGGNHHDHLSAFQLRELLDLDNIGQFITQGTPDFDTRTYGSAKLSDLVRKISRFEVRPGPGGQLQMRDVA